MNDGYGFRMWVKVLYQYSSVVDLTDREVLGARSPAHGEPSPAAGVGERGRRRTFGGVVQGSDRTVVWYRRSQ